MAKLGGAVTLVGWRWLVVVVAAVVKAQVGGVIILNCVDRMVAIRESMTSHYSEMIQ